MKVIIPVGALHVGGGCRVLAQVANALVKHGHDAEIVIPKKMPIEYSLLCKVTKVPELSAQYIPYGDIVLPNFYTTFQSAYEAWPNQCVRLSLGFEPFWVPDKVYAVSTYSHGIPIISISHWLDDQIYKHVRQRSTVVNLGIDPAIFHPKPKLKRTKSKSGTPVRILYIARDPKAGYELKGLGDFIKALKIFQRKFRKPFVVDLICPERRIHLSGIPHRIHQPKTDRQIARLYRAADLFVSTSWFEGFALPPLEAQACRTPVVTTDSGGIRDFIQHQVSGYIAKTRSPYSIAKGMITVLGDRKLSRKLKRYGLKSAQRLTVSNFETNIVKAIENIYNSR